MTDSHRPDAFSMQKPAEAVEPAAQACVHPPHGPTLRRFRPPWPVRVDCDAGPPAALSGRLEGGVRAALGPWLLEGEWWKPEAWAVETWQVEMEAGGLYQLARTRDGWCVEGMLD
jgi:protein ImuB